MPSNYYLIFEQGEKYVTGFCPDVPGANGQGLTKEECTKDLTEAIELLKKVRSEERQSNIPLQFLRHLRKNGCILKCESPKHQVWTNSTNTHLETVPKQVEIDKFLIENICKKLGIPMPWNTI